MKMLLALLLFLSHSAFGATEWGNLLIKGNLTAVGTTSLGTTSVGAITATSVSTPTIGSTSFSGAVTVGTLSATSLTATTIGSTSFTGTVAIGTLSASKLPVLNASKVWISSGVTATVLEYLANVTSDIQTQLNALQVALYPTGGILFYTGSACPTGFLAVDSSNISRSTYATLFGIQGTTYGAGDGSTTFGIGDARGVFIRGSGSQTISSISYTGTRGTTQGDQFQGHYHTFTNGISYSAGAFSAGGGAAGNTLVQATTGPITDGTNGTPRTGSETRPANVVYLVCVKT